MPVWPANEVASSSQLPGTSVAGPTGIRQPQFWVYNLATSFAGQTGIRQPRFWVLNLAEPHRSPASANDMYRPRPMMM